MLQTWLDHLVITAPSLAAGADYVRDALGVGLQPGGRHPRMATHNSLLKLGPSTYLEVIAVDPEAQAPDRARWFQLDQDRAAPARLATWVARTSDIHAAAGAPAFGAVEAMARGTLRWEITVPERGGLVFDGVAPLLIQWRTGPHPAALLPESGCTLVGLEGFHPQPEALATLLKGLGLREAFRVEPTAPGQAAQLLAHIQTPFGRRSLRGR